MIDEIRLSSGNLASDALYIPCPTRLLSSNNEDFQAYLKSRTQQISTALDQIFSGGSHSTPELSALQERIASLLANEKSHINNLEKLRLEKIQMEERLETASMRYMMAEKKLDRAKSMTVAKLERQAIAGGRNDAGTGIGGGADNSKSDSANGQLDAEYFAEAETAKRAALAASVKQSEQIEQLASENAKLIAQLTGLKLKSTSQTDEDYSHTDLFKQLKAQYEEAVKKTNHLESTNMELQQENSKYQAEKSSYKMKLEAESQAAISEKESVLNRAESDLARIRTARDELHADLALRKSTMEAERTYITNITDVLQARDDRIKAYESELERLHGGEGRADKAPGVESMTLEELKTKYSNLDRQYTMLNQELGSMSAAYKKISSTNSVKVANLSDLEEKILRLSAEKAKADQKYFAAMKSKEIKDNEIRTLRAQNSKSSDIVSQLKDMESSTKMMVVKLEKQVAELNEAISSLQGKARERQFQLDQQKITADGLKRQNEELKNILSTKDAAFSTASFTLRRFEVQVEELRVDIEEKDKRLETWKAKGLGSENEHYEVLRVSTLIEIRRHTNSLIESSNLYRLQKEFQEHCHQDMRPCLLPRVC